MATPLKSVATVLILMALSAPSAAQAQAFDPVAARLLAAHNRERTLVGAAPLQWDPFLAASAATYGPPLAALGGQLVHSPRASRPGQRENLWRGTRGAYSPEQMVGLWAAEKRYFRPGIFPAVTTTGNWMDVSHYTQMIWPTTLRVGCAIYATRTTDFLICRYSPPGNIDGKPVILPRRGERG
ncbi:MAG: CAP domain-containing protein [Pseudomonadota bacterium]|nr:CAP domain-containing protein [Pseudomonadota bacterium]